MSNPCATCKHYANGMFEFLLPTHLKSCSRPSLPTSPVTGVAVDAFAGLQRDVGCGRDGKYWEQA